MDGEKVHHIEITEVYKYIAISLTTIIDKIQEVFLPNKSFGLLLDISPQHFIFLKNFHSDFCYIKVWFTDQHYKPLQKEDRINTNLKTNINTKVKYK